MMLLPHVITFDLESSSLSVLFGDNKDDSNNASRSSAAAAAAATTTTTTTATTYKSNLLDARKISSWFD